MRCVLILTMTRNKAKNSDLLAAVQEWHDNALCIDTNDDKEQSKKIQIRNTKAREKIEHERNSLRKECAEIKDKFEAQITVLLAQIEELKAAQEASSLSSSTSSSSSAPSTPPLSSSTPPSPSQLLRDRRPKSTKPTGLFIFIFILLILFYFIKII